MHCKIYHSIVANLHYLEKRCFNKNAEQAHLLIFSRDKNQ